MRYILIVLLSLFSLLSQAAPGNDSNPCNLPEPLTAYNWNEYNDIKLDGTAVSCAPVITSQSTLPTIHSNDAGLMGYWYCKNAITKKWSPVILVASTAKLNASRLFYDGTTILNSDTKIATINILLKKNIDTPLSDTSLTPVWCPYVQEIYKTNMPTR
jgi:hypothetical protein